MGRFLRSHKIHIAVLAIVSFFAGWMLFVLTRAPLETQKDVIIKEGQSLNAVADTLTKENVIGNKFVFKVYTIVSGNEKRIKAGTYLFSPGVTVPEIIRILSQGLAKPDDIVVTIPEGFNVWDIDKKLAGAGLIKEGRFAEKYYADEGDFFPDTYRFKKTGETVDSIASKMKDGLNIKFAEIPIFLSSFALRDVLIKASILEKEARSDDDMRLVASVIQNRLARHMPLEIDATVAYGACLRKSVADKFLRDCDVSQVGVGAEIRIDSLYNSYLRPGLPAGPIANPGLAAIQAVLNPEKSDYLYYLSVRDGSRLIFSKTAAEHALNRAKYLGL